ncbi:TIGR02328 family protein [Lentibacillus sediminis]|uniref:TIGR02328 family protein n=1 Tax=Lentibacillus sediminis TaxID=1940529 RepID=UPI000C1C37C3|nr:TIGR02328 family protein [Lentibacillus sediminis]
MRLWHEQLLTKLPRQQLLGQHRECCALRGNGWGKQHATVNYVFHHSPYMLYLYHIKVMNEMKRRGYCPDAQWEEPYYRGKSCPPFLEQDFNKTNDHPDHPIYPEHDEKYLQECIENLREKGICL